MAVPAGIEPAPPPSEGGMISISPRDPWRNKGATLTKIKLIRQLNSHRRSEVFERERSKSFDKISSNPASTAADASSVVCGNIATKNAPRSR